MQISSAFLFYIWGLKSFFFCSFYYLCCKGSHFLIIIVNYGSLETLVCKGEKSPLS